MNKSLSIVGLGVLALLAVMAFASATPTFSISTPSPLSQQSSSFTVNVTDTPEVVNFTVASTTPDANGKTITASLDTTSFTFDATHTSKIITVTYTIPIGFVFQTGTTYSITITPSTGTPAVFNFAPTYEPTGVSTCKVTRAANTDTNDNLHVSIDTIRVTKGYGNSLDWYPLDSIESKITVDNNGNNDLRNVVVNWALFDTSNHLVVSSLHDKLSSFTLNAGDSKTVTVDFTLDPTSKFKTDSYMLYVWTTATDKTTSKTTCSVTNNVDTTTVNIDTVSSLGTIDIHGDSSDFVVLNNLQTVNSVTCGNTVQISGTVWNIGDNDEDNVYIKVFNTDLGVSQKVNFGTISSYDSKDISFNIAIPNNAQSGQSYDLTFLVYKGDNTIFQNDNGDKSQVVLTLPVTGTCSILPPATVSANLVNTPQPGQEFTVTATITNTDTKTNTFNLALNSYSSWASLESIDKTTVSLAAGQSQDVTIKMKANSDSSGTQTFNLVLTQGTETMNQPISVPIQSSSSSGSGITGLFSGVNGNTYLYGIAALNIILVLIIIIVAVRVVRKK